MLLTGEYEHTVDAKGRLAIPAPVRSLLTKAHDDQALYLTFGSDHTLQLFPERVFERLANQIEEGLVTDDAVREFELFLFPLSQRLEVDTAGRIRLPERMMKRAGLGKQVVLIGVRNHLEIRDPDAWSEELEHRLGNQSEIFNRFVRRTRTSDSYAAKANASGPDEGATKTPGTEG